MSIKNIYDQAEVDRIKKIKQTNDRLEIFFQEKRKGWNDNLKPLFEVLSLDPTNPSNSKKLLDYQSIALVYRQDINDQINHYLNKRSKETVKLKGLHLEKFVFYATSFGVKTSGPEKGKLIDANLAENQRTKELIDSYIDFLRDSVSSLINFGYSVKNMIQLLTYLGGQ